MSEHEGNPSPFARWQREMMSLDPTRCWAAVSPTEVCVALRPCLQHEERGTRDAFMQSQPYLIERAAQEAAERRLEILGEVQDSLMGGEDGRDVESAGELAGPCCEGCDTCTVREVLDAAYPHLLNLARLELGQLPQ